jgi:tRNA nucleotidyltransferase/poly(A) polymerase
LDPYHGLDDLKAGIIRMVNPTAFVEDPLRMMRAIQFASRFKFTIEENTWRAILDHADSIKEISGERILIELDKIYYKGDIVLGLDLFIKSTLHFRLFGFNPCITPTTLFLGFDRADFYSLIVKNEIQFINILKGETKTGKLIKAIKVASEKCEMIKKEHLHPARKMTSEIQKQFSYDMRKLVVELYKISEDIFDSILVRISISPTIVSDFITNIFPNSRLLPKSLKELEINGFELMEMGYTGKAIADVQKEILDEIFKDKLENNKEQIKNFLKIKAV